MDCKNAELMSIHFHSRKHVDDFRVVVEFLNLERLDSSWAGALRCAAVRLFIVLMCFWLTDYTACDVLPTHAVEFWPLSIFTGLFRGAS